MASAPVLATPSAEWIDEPFVSDELIDRLYRAGEMAVVELTASLSPRQRANLATICYRKSHLHRIGLAIAATCDEATLVGALGTAIGRTLFVQSRQPAREARAPGGHRPKITLAARQTIVAVPQIEVEDEPVCDDEMPETAFAMA